jgi:SAM-dependent methyltransferase
MNAPTEREKHGAPESEACPVCGGRAWTHLFESRSFSIGQCDRCALVRTLGVPTDGTVTYPPFDQRETVVVRAMRFAVTQLLRERAALVSKVMPSRGAAKKRLLDVGCGSGAFARLMSKRGYQAVGVEPFSLGRPVEEENLRLVRAPLAEVARTLGRFDVITMWHVLEHVDDPKALLGEVGELLEEGGVLVVSVPNFESWQSEVFKGGWFHLDPPRHVTHFTRATLLPLLEETGFVVLSERTFHFEYGPVGWLQSAMNRVLRPNFLFEFVKDRGALASVPASVTALNLAASGVMTAGLAAPAVVAEALAAARGKGSVLTFCVRRRGGAR